MEEVAEGWRKLQREGASWFVLLSKYYFGEIYVGCMAAEEVRVCVREPEGW
jgi:hypothetical protein